MDWHDNIIGEILDFGPQTDGTDLTFEETGEGKWQPGFYRAGVQATGQFADFSLAPGDVQPVVIPSPGSDFSDTPNQNNSINIFKDGTTFTIRFRMDVADFRFVRIM